MKIYYDVYLDYWFWNNKLYTFDLASDFLNMCQVQFHNAPVRCKYMTIEEAIYCLETEYNSVYKNNILIKLYDGTLIICAGVYSEIRNKLEKCSKLKAFI